jgi:mono/diheme cytochrome c family protein
MDFAFLLSAFLLTACDANRDMDRLRVLPAEKPQAHASARPFRPSATEPVIDLQFLRRGQENYEIHCRLCHGSAGFGDGHIPRHGFAYAPPSYHSAAARLLTTEYIFTVAKHGKGIMFGFGDRLTDATLLAIAHYVKVLQLSQNFPLGELTEAECRQLEGSAR